jgi:hypothetical protein
MASRSLLGICSTIASPRRGACGERYRRIRFCVSAPLGPQHRSGRRRRGMVAEHLLEGARIRLNEVGGATQSF